MISKNQLKLIQGLNQKKSRNKHNLFIAEGVKVVSELLNSNLNLHSVYVLTEFYTKLNNINSDKINIITELELKKISNLKAPNQVLALFNIPKTDDKISNDGLILALDDIRDPGNLGTIIRLADWFGVKSVLCSSNTVDVFNPKVIMATMGSISRVSVEYCDLYQRLKDINKPIYGAFLEGDNIYKTQTTTNSVIVIGNESNGISEEISELITNKITIPQFGEAQETESLNAAIATSILLSEFRRGE
ncbi:MAG: RNA methyltransferase [Ichthyobacteriaceae bacterium]|nr:RNA methyltransferase [Ichthyobacteriaceae bacterium]